MEIAGKSPLPNFENPPVVETVLSAQFEPLADMHTVHFGLFWERIRQQFPKTEDKPAIDPVFERFDDYNRSRPRLHFEAREAAVPERIWFVNEPGTEMIQLQVDRFIKNWRKSADEDIYPRYEKAIKPGFERDFQRFEDFAREQSLGPIQVNQCEVTYVNHIVAGQGWQNWGEAGKIFSFLSGLNSLEDSIEDGAFVIRQTIFREGQKVGRLTVEVKPALTERENKPMYVMNLTARGMTGSGIDFFDLGRRAIVSNFARLTTPAMHEVWGKK